MRRKEGLQTFLGGRMLRREEKGGAEYLFLLPRLNSTLGFEFSLPFPSVLSHFAGLWAVLFIPLHRPEIHQQVFQHSLKMSAQNYARKSGATLQLYVLTPAFEKITVLLKSKHFHMRNCKRGEGYTLKHRLCTKVKLVNVFWFLWGVSSTKVIQNNFISLVIYIPSLILSIHLHSPNQDPHLPLYFRPD